MSAVFTLNNFNTRLMTKSDIEQIMEIELSVYPHPWSEGIFLDCIKVGYKCYVLEDGIEIIGYSVMSLAEDEVHLLNISVKANRQNQGLGRELVNAMCEIAKSANADTMLLEVRPSNFAAVHLYDSLGFNEVGLRKNYYPSNSNEREDALIMAKALF